MLPISPSFEQDADTSILFFAHLEAAIVSVCLFVCAESVFVGGGVPGLFKIWVNGGTAHLTGRESTSTLLGCPNMLIQPQRPGDNIT
jgi:hypothetical protein